MSLSIKSFSDDIKNKFYQWCGENGLRDNLVRVQESFQDFNISAAEMDALNATVKTLLAAPGAGYANVVTGIFTFIDAGSTAFELGSGTLQFLYTDGSGNSVATAVPNTIVESASDAYYWSRAADVAPVLNAVIVAKASADVTAGNGVVYGRIFYKTVLVSELA